MWIESLRRVAINKSSELMNRIERKDLCECDIPEKVLERKGMKVSTPSMGKDQEQTVPILIRGILLTIIK
jgi:hypothetical protein